MVFGPDGKLYVSSLDNRDDPAFPGGYLGRFDADGRFELLFQGRLCPEGTAGAVEGSTCERGSRCDCFLHRPEGIVFGPDGRLYATSSRKNRIEATDVDRILVFDVSTRRRVDMIVLDSPTNRAFAQALLFGPAGRLFLPISTGGEDTAGEVRRYDVQTKTFDIFVPPASRRGPLQAPLYLTFCNTDPATLAYDDLGSGSRCHTHDP